MARFTDRDSNRKKVDELADRWASACLVSDGSLLFDDRQIWTAANLADFWRRFHIEEIRTSETFEAKLLQQVADAHPDVRWLACELVAVYLLFVVIAIGTDAKRELLTRIAGHLLTEDRPPRWDELMDAMAGGIAHPGVRYNINRDIQLVYLIDFATRFKRETNARRVHLLEQPWELRDFADDVTDGVLTPEMRHIVLHLLRPDEFERMTSATHKQSIVSAFEGFLDDEHRPEDLDEQVLAVRRALEAQHAQPRAHNGILDFYYSPLVEIWRADAERPGGATDLDLLLYKKQLVLYGSPGTGKTHRTRDLAAQVIRNVALEKWGPAKYFSSTAELDRAVEERVHWLQLHAAYGYEEFVRGLRLSADGGTTYVDGLLPRIVDQLESEPTDDRLPMVLVLDEINRTDISRMFGEAFSLLENRGRPVTLPGSDVGGRPRKLALPDDLYVIGTMNLIDQSVEELDFALRRRFFWRPVAFEASVVVDVNRTRWNGQGTRWDWSRAEPDMRRLADRATALNAEIAGSTHLGERYALGQSYFFDAAFFAAKGLRGTKSLRGGVLWDAKGKPRASLEDLWGFSIEPLLEQYLGGLDPTVAGAELKRLRQVLIADAT